MSKKHDRTLMAIFSDPVQSGILWRDIETMLKSIGAEISERRGSRVCISLNGIDAVFHRPHPRKETDKGAINSMRRFLKEAGVGP
ncbi:MAG: type II toxin-antitoxin system HicA family toxin [Alphaproteobacteria bacterium]